VLGQIDVGRIGFGLGLMTKCGFAGSRRLGFLLRLERFLFVCTAIARCWDSLSRARSASSSAASAFVSARVARIACHVLITTPNTSATATAAPALTISLFRRANFLTRYTVLGGRASTGSCFRCRSMSNASPLAVS
jgi:hypothetical protein